MRNLTLSIIALGACFTVFTSVQAQANMTLFTFDDGIEDESSDLSISRYMTGVMGSRVIVDDAEVNDNNDEWFDTYWFHKDWSDNFLRCDTRSGDIEIIFNKPITRAYGDGYAFIPQFGYDYHVMGYDDTYGSDHENPLPGALVNSQSINTGWGLEADFDLACVRTVSLLVLSNGGKDWIGVDNLCVQPVPVPGAGLLGALGMGVTGWLKRRKTL